MFLGLLLGTLALTACTSVGPNFKAPAAPSATRYTHGMNTASEKARLSATQNLSIGRAVARDWWTVFGSSELNNLVMQALQNNFTIAAALATLRQARQLYAAQSGSTLYPTVNGNLAANRNKSNVASIGQKGSEHTIYNLYNAGINVNYNLDLFGGNRRALEALAAQAEYQRFQLAGARLTVAANVVTGVIDQAQLRDQVVATEAIIMAQQNQVDIASKRFKLGAIARLDLLTLQTQLEQTRATLPSLRNRLDQTDHLLATLIGQAPAVADIPKFSLVEFSLPTQLPMVIPSQLVRRRPDIQASTALLQEATAQYGVAVSKLFPQINLSASLGYEALTTSALFGPGSLVWTLAGQLAQPLFNAGLRAGANAAQASLQAAGANYQQTVLLALRNVADVLRQLDNDAQGLQAQVAADTASQESLKLVQQQYQLGAASYLQLLTAQQQAQQTRLSLIAAQAARLVDSAALYQAMGGGVLEATSTMASEPHSTQRTGKE